MRRTRKRTERCRRPGPPTEPCRDATRTRCRPATAAGRPPVPPTPVRPAPGCAGRPGSDGLVGPWAAQTQLTRPAPRVAGGAHVTPELDEPHGDACPLLRREERLQVLFDLVRVGLVGELEPPRHPLHVGVDGDRRLVPR